LQSGESVKDRREYDLSGLSYSFLEDEYRVVADSILLVEAVTLLLDLTETLSSSSISSSNAFGATSSKS
jgi:hypothetical protein